jgi:hypothetical protein
MSWSVPLSFMWTMTRRSPTKGDQGMELPEGVPDEVVVFDNFKRG